MAIKTVSLGLGRLAGLFLATLKFNVLSLWLGPASQSTGRCCWQSFAGDAKCKAQDPLVTCNSEKLLRKCEHSSSYRFLPRDLRAGKLVGRTTRWEEISFRNFRVKSSSFNFHYRFVRE